MTKDTNEPAVDSSLLSYHDRKKVKVVVVGQMPPPVNGQSMMIRSFVEGKYKSLEIVYVPMRFSRSTAEIGSFNFRKVILLVQTLFQIVAARLKSGATILYYPPAGANLVPVLRDMFLLLPTRCLFLHTVFHFHAAGLSKIYQRLPKLLRGLFHVAYDRPELAIFTTAATSADARFLRAKKTVIIPCGIADQAASTERARTSVEVPSILFAGILCAEKGVLVLLESCHRLLKSAVPFRLTCIGAFQAVEFEQRVHGILEETGLDRVVEFPGVITGSEKDDLFASADVFCFPSYYPAESFGVVLIEAMSFSLPIVATDWQGIPEVVGRLEEGIDPAGALLVPPRDVEALTNSLKRMLSSPEERIAMGRSNRVRYLEHFTVERYRTRLEDALAGLDQEHEDMKGIASAET